MSGYWQIRLFTGVVAAITVLGLAYVYAYPPESMRTTREHVPHFTPPVIHPETGEALDVRELVRHYRGD